MKHDWIRALIGGALIGQASTILLLTLGRIAGISGIVAGILAPTKNETRWRISFVLGLMLGGMIVAPFNDQPFPQLANISGLTIGIAGLLVGFGTRLGGGCTSGHGVCGISRLSLRSILATVSFMTTGALTVYIASYLQGLGS